MATGYLELLRARHAVRLLTGTLVGRLPNATAALAVVLFTRAHGGDYTLAGALSAVYGLGNAVGQPLLGRLVDKRGQPRVMLGGALVAAAATTLFALTGPRPVALSCALMAVAGLATPPLEGGLRALWPSVLSVPGQVHAAYALDAAAQEVMYAAGPLLVTLLTAAGSAGFAVVALALVGVAGTVAVVSSPPSRRWRAPEREAHWLGPLRAPGLLALLGSLFFVGLALGSIAVAAVAYADAHGGGMVSSYLLSALGLGALAGGVGYGARRWAGVPERRLRLLMVCLAVCYLPLALTPGVPLMTVLAGISGLFLAPVLACAFVVVDRHAPAGTVTEAFSWLVTAFGVGASAGTAVAGPAAQYGGVPAAFAVAGAGGVVALAVLLACGRFLVVPTVRQQRKNDRIGTVEPGFSGTHRA
ncbi:major facilitator superfamily permease [Streptantibioticus cattleyicolor NRRL 8057 = DSM 46488]|uniref:Major facilitator superfamily permease n=1 Tax=Streptantibioticus cattleyicolor (strain ATCC 35852 / DSM 46488 / JCM 4925 / NBRC 14057 / NRRL 8057) TaxID=1003195 RepID=F8K2M9_STREN|nr:major facilitator superfamily permease [Streptantibioticus cattleyicolor NRRL 8057 = DSM 46488]MYS61973.1 MFS transporter [Streptomyces sp. SID5468]CCB77864.1 putative permease of the major facilitator superfamily [Streptantibioticus cattleyicolor NRRL 8057 = DSM 46488]